MASDSAKAQNVPASEKIVLGVIGLGGRGTSVMRGFMKYPDVEIGAVCDLHDGRLAAGREAAGGKAKTYKDFRKLLEQKDIDAVLVTTPPHWHPLISIAACEAGKDVYCEKPISRYPAEAIAMAKAARDNKRVTQVGTQIHAGGMNGFVGRQGQIVRAGFAQDGDANRRSHRGMPSSGVAGFGPSTSMVQRSGRKISTAT